MDLSEPLQQMDRTYVRYRGRKLAYFAGCDYYRMASHPKVLQAIQGGLSQFGLNVAASRLTTGNHKIFGRLEEKIADFFGVETATLGANGYATNLIVAQAFAGEFSHAILDERAHVSLVDAAQFLNCPILKFKHRNPMDLAALLHRLGHIKPLLLTDGLFSHDGGIAPLEEYVRLLPHDGMILVDDAHGAGVLGAGGQGTLEHAGLPRRSIIQTITLSKAFGVYGGAALGPAELRDKIIARSHLFVGNTPLPLPLAQAAITSMSVFQRNAAMRRRLVRNTRLVKKRLRAANFDVFDNPSPIVPFVPKDAEQAAKLRSSLLAAGIFPALIKYPGGPENGYFRFVISSEHTAEQLKSLVDVLLATST